jgi:DNA polymerase III delta prime subunit
MEKLNINSFLNKRNEIEENIINILNNFNENYNKLDYKKGIYIYGAPGCGKTYFVSEILKKLDYDMIKYDAGDIRNKNLIETITSNNISNRNVLDMMTGKEKKIAIVMDEIDGMNNGDKGGLTALVKLIRQKKTKKQKTEGKTMNPIICIGNYYTDKKMRELMKVCNIFELPKPTNEEIKNILSLDSNRLKNLDQEKVNVIVNYIEGDMRKLKFSLEVLNENDSIDNEQILKLFHLKSYNEDSKSITNQLLERKYDISMHNNLMNETDRTIVALLWHENVIDKLEQKDKESVYPIYYKILRNICFADYIDRITFQSQIWEFNEMSSLIKTFYNNKIFHDSFENEEFKPLNEIRFTKVLTKYSTEYNNSLFIQDLSQKLSMEKKDIVSFFQEIRLCMGKDFCEDGEILSNIENMFEDYDICKLDIKRFYRYLDKNSKKDAITDEFE